MMMVMMMMTTAIDDVVVDDDGHDDDDEDEDEDEDEEEDHDDDDNEDDDDVTTTLRLQVWVEVGGRDGCWRMLWSSLRTNYDASTEATADITSVHAATRAVGCSPHQRSWHTCGMLHLHRDPRANLSKGKGIRIEKRQEKKEGHNPDRRKGKKEGGREGRKEGGRQEERKEGLAPKCCVHVAGPKQFANVGSTCGKDRAVYRC